MTNTATLIRSDLHQYGGPGVSGRLYRLDPPLVEDFNGAEHTYVVVFEQPPFRAEFQIPDVHLFGADADGNPTCNHMKSLAHYGHSWEPQDWVLLQIAGGYTIVAPPDEEPRR